MEYGFIHKLRLVFHGPSNRCPCLFNCFIVFYLWLICLTKYPPNAIELQAPTAAMTSGTHLLLNKTPDELEAAVPPRRTTDAWQSEHRIRNHREWTGEYTRF